MARKSGLMFLFCSLQDLTWSMQTSRVFAYFVPYIPRLSAQAVELLFPRLDRPFYLKRRYRCVYVVLCWWCFFVSPVRNWETNEWMNDGALFDDFLVRDFVARVLVISHTARFVNDQSCTVGLFCCCFFFFFFFFFLIFFFNILIF
jgi:hypothetical protein